MAYVLSARDDLTSKPQEVIHGAEELHGHVVVHEGVLQHPGLEAQIPHMLAHAPLAPLLVVSTKHNAQTRITAGAPFLPPTYTSKALFNSPSTQKC